jgi:hypothetical protein
LIALLVVAWKWELIGGIIFVLIGIGLAPTLFIHNYHINHSIWMSMLVILMLNAPFIIVGVLFVVNHYKKRQISK